MRAEPRTLTSPRRRTQRATRGLDRRPPRARARRARRASLGVRARRSTSSSAQRAPKRRGGSVNVDRLVVGVEEEQERVVRRSARRARVRARISSPLRKTPSVRSSPSRPVALRHPAAVGAEPPARPAGPSRSAPPGEELRPPEDRVRAAKRDQTPRELEQRLRRSSSSQSNQDISLSWHQALLLPLLRAAELVAAEQHRHALREQQRGRGSCAAGARAARAPPGRRSGPRRRSSSCGCRRCRRGCPRRSPRCASRCRRRGRRA